jgi:simple sugar transport system ATP-binding protein
VDEGEIRVDGVPRVIRSPADAIAAGIGMVTQHFSLVGPMTVAENLALGRDRGFRLDMAAARRRVADAAERFGIRVDPGARVADLSIGQQQRVEILKALARDCRVLILDEPTAVLVPQEVDALFETIERFRAEGLAVAFISHKLGEVRAITQRVTVLRRGAVVGSVATADADERQLAAMMVGRPTFGVSRSADEVDVAEGAGAVLRVTNLDADGQNGLPALRDVSFEIRAGEILGVAGVSGNGQAELAEVLSGTRVARGGSIEVEGAQVATGSVPAVMVAGVGRIPEDRHASLVGELSVAYNLALEDLASFVRGGRLDEPAIQSRAAELIERFDIRARPGDRVAGLSGGNMQKVLLARVLSRDPKVLVVAQPTRGLDVGATDYVRRQLLARRAAGTAILLISEDLDELLALADRVIVLYEGRVVGSMTARDADRDQLGMLMAGRLAA